MTNNDKYEAAKKAIYTLFEDQSVSFEECKENLESLKNEIEILISSVESDIDIDDDKDL